MTIQELQRNVTTVPFEPFRVMTADGKSYDVLSREHLAFSGKGRLISIGMPDDSFVVLDLLLVTAIQKPIPRRKSRPRGAA
jgi:hypothetical protein